MTVSRPRLLRAGDDILLGGELRTVQAVSATVVRLADVVGTVSTMPLAAVLASPGFALVSSARAPAPLPPSGLLDGIPEAEAEQARWWERHIVEILTGLPPEHPPGAAPKPAAILRPTTKAADVAVLLARALTPEPMRPGWVDALRMSRSVLPHRRLTEVDERLEHAAARPMIVPETIVCDHGNVYISRAFLSACRAMGINFQPTHKGSPWEKGTVETSFNAVGSLFAQYVAGYVGSSVERRGEKAEQDAVWSIAELQALLDEWIVTWQNRPHSGLRHPVAPDKALTPNEQYAALVEVTGYVPVPLSANDYVELLPVSWNAINKDGVRLHNRTYDCGALTPYRRQHSGVERRKGLWEVHYDPYDVTRIWVRNHHVKDAGWITVSWKHLSSTPAPFGELAWQHAREILARRGQDQATEAEIAQAASDLLDRAGSGPEHADPAVTKRERRVAGRTRATSLPSGPRPGPDPGDDEPESNAPAETPQDAGQPTVTVVPLPVFDARKEAELWLY